MGNQSHSHLSPIISHLKKESDGGKKYNSSVRKNPTRVVSKVGYWVLEVAMNPLLTLISELDPSLITVKINFFPPAIRHIGMTIVVVI